MLKVMLNRLKPQAKEIITEEHTGFRAGRSTTEQIYNLRILCEKYFKQQILYNVIIDFKKKKKEKKKLVTRYGVQPYRPSCGFRAGRSTTEQIYNLRILCDKYFKHQQILYNVYH